MISPLFVLTPIRIDLLPEFPNSPNPFLLSSFNYLSHQFQFHFQFHPATESHNLNCSYMPPSAQETGRHAPLPPPRYLSRSQRKLLLFFLKCVIMVVVIALFLFFLGFAAIVLLHFLFMSNTFNRRCARLFHHHTHPADDDAPSATSADLPLLPDVAYSATAFSWTSDCAICLESFQMGDECRNIPFCRHLFHAKCLDRWIRKKPTCPVCRTRVDLDPFMGAGACGDDQWKRLWGAVNFEEGTSY